MSKMMARFIFWVQYIVGFAVALWMMATFVWSVFFTYPRIATIADFYSDLSSRQQPLGNEFSTALAANVEDLYEA